jgi:hypothetical protein
MGKLYGDGSNLTHWVEEEMSKAGADLNHLSWCLGLHSGDLFRFLDICGDHDAANRFKACQARIWDVPIEDL